LLSNNIEFEICKAVILPVGLYYVKLGPVLGQEHRMRVFQNRLLRKIFGHKRDKVTGEWTELPSPNIIQAFKSRRMRWVEHVAHTEDGRGAYRILVGIPAGKKPLGMPKHRWEDNIKMELNDVGWGGMDWIDLAQDRDRWWAVMKAVMNLRVP
jgi:hypothetical protein